MPAFFDLPLDLPHAGRVALRLARRLTLHGPEYPEAATELLETTDALVELLLPFAVKGENGDPGDAAQARGEALAMGRRIVDEVERLGWGEDRLGQCVRNLFELLEHGAEGAAISLRAGEDPASIQRPA